MSKKIHLPFVKVKPITEVAEVTTLEPGWLLFDDGTGVLKKISTETFYQLLNGFAKPLKITDSSPTVDGWYKPEDAGTYANAGGKIAQEGYDTLFYKSGSTWTRTQVKMPESKISTWTAQSYVSGKQVFYQGKIYELGADAISTDVPGASSNWVEKVNSFSETEFNKVAQNIGISEISLTSKDLTGVNFDQTIASGQGNSIFTVKIDSNLKISKLKVKVTTAGLGDFTARRGSSIIPIITNVALEVGWNEIQVDFDAIADDYIGYSTLNSTSNLSYTDSGTGKYYTINSSNNIVEWTGNIALEVYKKDFKGNLLGDLINQKKLNTEEFNRINKYSIPLLRKFDYGVVSAFVLPDINDIMGNNKINITSTSIYGNFNYDAYAWSFGFIVNMPNMYSTTKNICTINLGSYSLTIYVGGSGIGATVDGVSNGIAYNYGNKKLKIEIIADAYLLNIIVDGQRIGFLNIGKRATQFNFSLITRDDKTFENLAFWNRDISIERAIQYGIDQDPFILKGIQDKLFPSTGKALSNHFFEGSPYFDVPAEQTIVEFKGKFFMYFSGQRGTPSAVTDSGVCVAVSSRVDGGYMMYTNDAVIGGNRGKAGINRAMASWAGVIGEFIYVFTAIDYTAPSAGGKIFKSSDGLNFSLVGNFIPTGISELANIGIYPVKQPNNYYYGVVEGMNGGTWALNLVRSLNIESGWEVVQMLPTLAVNPNGMYGGADLMRSINNDRWMIIYHSAYELNGNAPTALFYAESTETEPKNWVKKGKVLDINDELNYYNAFNCDQVATPQIIEANGKTYISEVLAQNNPTLHCQIRILEFDGTKEELFGIIPID